MGHSVPARLTAKEATSDPSSRAARAGMWGRAWRRAGRGCGPGVARSPTTATTTTIDFPQRGPMPHRPLPEQCPAGLPTSRGNSNEVRPDYLQQGGPMPHRTDSDLGRAGLPTPKGQF